jgi:cyclopropane fatty-acyl-phospholipid synthase-like methyltransferase
VVLTRQDILAALETDTGSYDVVYSSFALHHLSTEQKGAFFRLVAQRLAKDGVLVLTDVVREADESLPVYLEHYCDWLRKDWNSLDAVEIAAICDHIENNDRPETFADLQAMAHAAGLTDAAGVSGYRWHRVVRFQR